MPRIRSIKPEFFASEDVSVLPLRARLTWIGLWTQCDDHGRTKRNGKLIKASIWPLDDVTLRDVEEDLQDLVDAGRIVTYEVDSTPLLAVVNWHVHQSINRPSKPKHPGPPEPLGSLDESDPSYCEHCASPGPEALTQDSLNTHGALTLGKERKGKEGTRVHAREPPPPRTCPKHPNGTESPCRACGTARLAAEDWAVEQRKRVSSSVKCRVHRGQLANNCALCRAEELSPA